jgi:hypothetical protein
VPEKGEARHGESSSLVTQNPKMRQPES